MREAIKAPMGFWNHWFNSGAEAPVANGGTNKPQFSMILPSTYLCKHERDLKSCNGN
jgi:hypothetical protein